MEKYISDFFTVIRNNIETIIKGDYEVGKTDLNTLCNLALMRLDRGSVTPSVKGMPKLTKEQRRRVKRFYDPYVKHLTDRYHRLYTVNSGKFHSAYLPEELYIMHVDRYFSDRKEAIYLDNKCYYYRLFSNVKQPDLVAMRIGDSWLDGKVEPVSLKDLLRLLRKEPEVVIKRAVNSEGGYGIEFIDGKTLAENFSKMFRTVTGDVVIQRPVRQHPMLAELHNESVNTFRIVSLMTKDKVKIYAVCLKIGAGTARVDNGCHGGMYCGVRPNGTLRDYAVLDNGTVLHQHPDLGYRFSDKKVPELDKAIALVKKAHSFMGHFRLISWDVTINDEGEAVLIEANLTMGGINDVQMCNGPLFGKDTHKILDEVFKGKKKITTLL